MLIGEYNRVVSHGDKKNMRKKGMQSKYTNFKTVFVIQGKIHVLCCL